MLGFGKTEEDAFLDALIGLNIALNRKELKERFIWFYIDGYRRILINRKIKPQQDPKIKAFELCDEIKRYFENIKEELDKAVLNHKQFRMEEYAEYMGSACGKFIRIWKLICESSPLLQYMSPNDRGVIEENYIALFAHFFKFLEPILKEKHGEIKVVKKRTKDIMRRVLEKHRKDMSEDAASYLEEWMGF